MHELKQARNMAHARIDKDSNRALKKVHNNAPGNYNPKIKQLRTMRREQQTAPAAGTPSSSSLAAQKQPTHPNDTEENDVKLSYHEEASDNKPMGPR